MIYGMKCLMRCKIWCKNVRGGRMENARQPDEMRETGHHSPWFDVSGQGIVRAQIRKGMSWLLSA
jgi:hypothetical protein